MFFPQFSFGLLQSKNVEKVAIEWVSMCLSGVGVKIFLLLCFCSLARGDWSQVFFLLLNALGFL